jgi:hypothetical protein
MRTLQELFNDLEKQGEESVAPKVVEKTEEKKQVEEGVNGGPKKETDLSKETPEQLMNEENSKANVLKKAIESVNKKKEQEKKTGKEKGPGVPDGTGPYGGTEKCPMTKKEEQTPGMLQKNAHIMAGFITEVGGIE